MDFLVAFTHFTKLSNLPGICCWLFLLKLEQSLENSIELGCFLRFAAIAERRMGFSGLGPSSSGYVPPAMAAIEVLSA